MAKRTLVGYTLGVAQWRASGPAGLEWDSPWSTMPVHWWVFATKADAKAWATARRAAGFASAYPTRIRRVTRAKVPS